jgi:hypothetical protein
MWGGEVQVPKKLAIFGFNLCASIFLGFCVYGLLIYAEGGKGTSGGVLSSLLYGLCIVACIVGICYFGAQWDRRNAEEAIRKNDLPSSAKKRKAPSPDS